MTCGVLHTASYYLLRIRMLDAHVRACQGAVGAVTIVGCVGITTAHARLVNIEIESNPDDAQQVFDCCPF